VNEFEFERGGRDEAGRGVLERKDRSDRSVGYLGRWILKAKNLLFSSNEHENGMRCNFRSIKFRLL
jgi:hypothetical protein